MIQSSLRDERKIGMYFRGLETPGYLQLSLRDTILIAKTRSHPPGALDPRMVRRNHLQLARDFGDRHRLGAVTARCDHDAENFLFNQIHAHRSQPRRQQAIARRRRAAALDVTE